MFGRKSELNRIDGGRLRRADLCLMAFFLLLALGFIVLSATGRKTGQTLRISCDGQVLAEVSLLETQGQETESNEAVRYCLICCGEHVTCEWYEAKPDLASAVPKGSGYNLLAVSEARVFMESANCRDQICVHHIPIAGGGESIICLPHRLVVEIVGETDSKTPDVIAKTGSADSDFIEEGRRNHETDG